MGSRTNTHSPRTWRRSAAASAAAVVTEVGGPLSHAAVVAREFGIPAVVGTSVALSTLVDGELLEVDGSAGIVRRLEA